MGTDRMGTDRMMERPDIYNHSWRVRPNIYDSKVECSSPVRLPQSDSHDLGYQSSEIINVFLAPDDAIGGPRPAMPLNNLDDIA